MRVVCVCVCVCGSVCFLLSIEICVPVVFSDGRCSCEFVCGCVNVCQSVLVLDSLFLFLCRFVVGSFVCEISVCVCVRVVTVCTRVCSNMLVCVGARQTVIVSLLMRLLVRACRCGY